MIFYIYPHILNVHSSSFFPGEIEFMPGISSLPSKVLTLAFVVAKLYEWPFPPWNLFH